MDKFTKGELVSVMQLIKHKSKLYNIDKRYIYQKIMEVLC
jgi:hypothetical protein